MLKLGNYLGAWSLTVGNLEIDIWKRVSQWELSWDKYYYGWWLQIGFLSINYRNINKVICSNIDICHDNCPGDYAKCYQKYYEGTD